MPYYDYSCRDCHSVTSIKASIEEKEAGLVVRCEACGSTETEQAFLNVAIATGGRAEAGPCGHACGCFPGN
jgi:putative FmdB family regulatory protein